ncbi:MAG: hypothetical protein IJA67_01280 [Oscillospiraceae bacterium]|nr:hypothetical protein [Oscillospiraceae bacterium]
MSDAMKEKISKLALIVFAVAIALFSLVNTSFKTEIQRDVHLDIYENGAVVGQTVVHIDGTRAEFLLGNLTKQEETFTGRFAIELAERTCHELTSAAIWWRDHGGGMTYQNIAYFSAATSLSEDKTVKHVLLINPDMTEMAIQMTDGRVLASSEKVYDIYMEYFTYNAANGTTGVASGIPEF